MKKTTVIALKDLNSVNSEIKAAHNGKVQNFGIKALVTLFLVTSALAASAQKSAVSDAFSKHGIDASILNADNLQQPTDYAFDLRQTTIAGGKQTVTVAKFDPSSPKEEQWSVVSINGSSPSKSDNNTFRKNQAKQQTSNQADEASYKIEKETADNLVISYKMDAGSIPKDASFMKDCRFYMTVNLRTKKLEQVEAINEKPVKIKILNAEKFDLIIKYNWNAQAKRYFSANEDLNIQAKFIGQPVTVQTTSEYSNYTKK